MGLAIAQRLAAEGARLVLVGRHEDKLTHAADLVPQAGAPDVWATEAWRMTWWRPSPARWPASVASTWWLVLPLRAAKRRFRQNES
ncbi:SDR family oxidoreductase [Hymenobacter arizonensis]|uniref:SDR family oxidoreductase n=1 Tax=Hymenobacter arizonensis TaxID=1227077 RepID=UPI0011605FE2